MFMGLNLKPGPTSDIPWIVAATALFMLVAMTVVDIFRLNDVGWRTYWLDRAEAVVGIHHHHLERDIRRSR